MCLQPAYAYTASSSAQTFNIIGFLVCVSAMSLSLGSVQMCMHAHVRGQVHVNASDLDSRVTFAHIQFVVGFWDIYRSHSQTYESL